MNARSFLMVRKVTEIIFGCSMKGCKSRRSIECNEKDEGRSSLALLTQFNVCILDAKSNNDEEPAAIISMQLKCELKQHKNKLYFYHSLPMQLESIALKKKFLERT